jgi:HD-GYP domain-containing protein (c-di-GMP phosphodiesterase class II)
MGENSRPRWSRVGRAALAAVFSEAPGELLELSNPGELLATVVDLEPSPRRGFHDDAALDSALAGFGDAADLKSPWFQGHARGVAQLARDAATLLIGDQAQLVYRAGLLHDLGRVAVPTGVWERPGSLRLDELELVRLHPYNTGRNLSRSPFLAPIGDIACRHHERIDGSGYPAGVRSAELQPAACILAAADAYHAMTEPRPHRAALNVNDAAKTLAAQPLDRDAIRAVLDVAGACAPALPPLPAGLTERELEVLRLLAAGRTKREIATELVVSPATIHTHTVHIYDKCGVKTRAGLAMFAMKHGLASRIH